MKYRILAAILILLFCLQRVGFAAPQAISAPFQAPHVLTRPVLPDPTIPKVEIQTDIPKPFSNPSGGIEIPENVVRPSEPEGFGFLSPAAAFISTIAVGIFGTWGQKEAKESSLAYIRNQNPGTLEQQRELIQKSLDESEFNRLKDTGLIDPNIDSPETWRELGYPVLGQEKSENPQNWGNLLNQYSKKKNRYTFFLKAKVLPDGSAEILFKEESQTFFEPNLDIAAFFREWAHTNFGIEQDLYPWIVHLPPFQQVVSWAHHTYRLVPSLVQPSEGQRVGLFWDPKRASRVNAFSTKHFTHILTQFTDSIARNEIPCWNESDFVHYFRGSIQTYGTFGAVDFARTMRRIRQFAPNVWWASRVAVFSEIQLRAYILSRGTKLSKDRIPVQYAFPTEFLAREFLKIFQDKGYHFWAYRVRNRYLESIVDELHQQKEKNTFEEALLPLLDRQLEFIQLSGASLKSGKK